MIEANEAWSDETHEELVAAIMAGEDTAVARLYEKFRSGLRIVVGRSLNWSDDTEDIVEEVLITTIEVIKRGELRDRRTLPGFIRIVAQNCIRAAAIGASKRRRQISIDAAATVMQVQHAETEIVNRERREILQILCRG